MKRDYLADSIWKLHDAFTLLADGERKVEQAKHIRDRDERNRQKRQAEQQIQTQYPAMTAKVPAAAFHYLVTTKLADKDGLRTYWQERLLGNKDAAWNNVEKEWKLKDLAESFEQVAIPLVVMPPLSFHLSFKFTLAKPYLSRDDDDFYILDNPVKKDKVLKLPYVSPSSWKGALRSVMRQQLGDKEDVSKKNRQPFNFDKPEVERLFGIDKRNEKRIEDEDFNAGRLRFFPTFFKQISLEIINPHLRKTGAGDKPILFETVPRGSEGQFNLLYFPFNLSATDYNETAKDLEHVVKAVEAMFTVYGFGAKTSDGFGVAEKKISGTISLRLEETVEKPDEPEEKPLALFGGSVSVKHDKKSKPKQNVRKDAGLQRSPISVRQFEGFIGSKKTRGLEDVAKELAGKLREKGGEG